MAKAVKRLPLSAVERIRLYINEGRKTLEEIKEETGADYLLNGGLFEGSRAVCHLKADGTVYAGDPYTYWGYAWDGGPDMAPRSIPAPDRQNYIACVCLLREGRAEPLVYNRELGGSRARTAIGLKGGELCLYCTDRGRTPEELQAEALAMGWDSAVMLDGGGSAQCDLGGGAVIRSNRRVHNLICIHLKKKEESPMDQTYTVCLDPGHGPGTVNGSPDGTYKEREFCWDMYERIRPLLEARGVNVVCTRTEEVKPSLTARAEVSNQAGADCFVSLHTNAAGNGGWYPAAGLEIYTSSGPAEAPRNVLAAELVRAFSDAGVRLRAEPIKHNMDLTVLVKTQAPAVLIEYGYHTNEEDTALLKSDGYRTKLAEATARGVCDWLGVTRQDGERPDTAGDAPAEWASESWRKAVDRSVLDGTRPQDPVTRQELAVVLDRLGLLE